MSTKKTDWAKIQREGQEKAHRSKVDALEQELKHTKDTLERVKKANTVRQRRRSKSRSKQR